MAIATTTLLWASVVGWLGFPDGGEKSQKTDYWENHRFKPWFDFCFFSDMLLTFHVVFLSVVLRLKQEPRYMWG